MRLKQLVYLNKSIEREYHEILLGGEMILSPTQYLYWGGGNCPLPPRIDALGIYYLLEYGNLLC